MYNKSDFKKYLKTGQLDARKQITAIPQNAQRYLQAHKAQINRWKTKPDWLELNFTNDLTLYQNLRKAA